MSRIWASWAGYGQFIDLMGRLWAVHGPHGQCTGGLWACYRWIMDLTGRIQTLCDNREFEVEGIYSAIILVLCS